MAHALQFNKIPHALQFNNYIIGRVTKNKTKILKLFLKNNSLLKIETTIHFETKTDQTETNSTKL